MIVRIKTNKVISPEKLIKNAIVTYKDGDMVLFDAVLITEREVIFGSISNEKKFLEFGAIPIENIKNIESNPYKKIQYSGGSI